MFKVRRFVCLALVCALVGVAYAAAHKIRTFTPQGSELATADGMAILNFAQGTGGPLGTDGKTIVHIMITGFTPFTTYDVDLLSRTQGHNFGPGILVTDEHGDAQFHGDVPAPDISDSDIYIYVNMGRAAQQELRAVGLQ
jgi:hypothetical protein